MVRTTDDRYLMNIDPAMQKYPQFILRAADKTPLNPVTLTACDPHDPVNWMSYDSIMPRHLETGLGIGFVFTDNDNL